MDLVLEIVDNTLSSDGGFFIYQSYASDAKASHPEYVRAMKKQLELLGIQLLDIYYYERHPHVHLVVAVRGKMPELKHEITSFHGRGQQTGRVMRSSYL